MPTAACILQNLEPTPTPPAPIVPRPTGGVGAGGGWSGERVGWWPICETDEERRNDPRCWDWKVVVQEEEELLVVTRIVLEEETYWVEEDGSTTSDHESQLRLEGDSGEDPPRLPPKPSSPDEDGPDELPGDAPMEEAPQAATFVEPPDWWGFLGGAVISYVASRAAIKMHPLLGIGTSIAGLYLTKGRPWAQGGVVVGTGVAFAQRAEEKLEAKREAAGREAEPLKFKKRKSYKKPKPGSAKKPVELTPKPKTKSWKQKKRTKVKIQRMRVFGRRVKVKKPKLDGDGDDEDD